MSARRSNLKIVENIHGNELLVECLRSFTLYNFNLVAENDYGSSRPVCIQEYTGFQ